jgi:hypothetical protein
MNSGSQPRREWAAHRGALLEDGVGARLARDVCSYFGLAVTLGCTMSVRRRWARVSTPLRSVL